MILRIKIWKRLFWRKRATGRICWCRLLNQILNLVRVGGKVLQFGHDELAKSAIQVAEIVRKEITIYGVLPVNLVLKKWKKLLKVGFTIRKAGFTPPTSLSGVHKGIDLLKKQADLKIILHPEELINDLSLSSVLWKLSYFRRC